MICSRTIAAAAMYLLAACAPAEVRHEVTMELPKRDCGGVGARSAFDRESKYHWEKDGRLVVTASLSESGSIRVKDGSARLEVKGNLITLTYETVNPTKGTRELPIMCNWTVPGVFRVSGLDARSYYLLIASQSEDWWGVEYVLSVLAPDD